MRNYPIGVERDLQGKQIGPRKPDPTRTPKIARIFTPLPVRFEIVRLISTVREHLAGYSPKTKCYGASASLGVALYALPQFA